MTASEELPPKEAELGKLVYKADAVIPPHLAMSMPMLAHDIIGRTPQARQAKIRKRQQSTSLLLCAQYKLVGAIPRQQGGGLFTGTRYQTRNPCMTMVVAGP